MTTVISTTKYSAVLNKYFLHDLNKMNANLPQILYNFFGLFAVLLMVIYGIDKMQVEKVRVGNVRIAVVRHNLIG